VYGWAVGGKRLVLPTAAGIPIGGSSTRYVIVEFHINNPSHLTGVNVAGLGVNLTTTTVLRTHNAATLTTGDNGIQMPTSQHQPNYIAAGASEVKLETSCASACTSTFPSPINLYASFLHMHAVGKKIWLTRTAGAEVSVVDARQYWNFGFQDTPAINATVSPGDKLNLHCVYDSSLYSSAVSFGLASSNEMCMAFLFYYPAMNVNFCGYQYNDFNTCGSLYSAITSPTNPQTGIQCVMSTVIIS
jgi:hypothetical protein